jgi:hypothetical protein
MDNNSMGTQVQQTLAPNFFSGRNVAIACGVLAVLTICACALTTVGVFAYYGREPETLTVEYSIPYTVTRGEEFELVLTLTNTGNEAVYVGDIDLDEAFGGSILDGAITISTDPYMDRDFSTSGIKTFKYDRSIPAGTSAQVTFRMQAVAVGEYGGSIGVYVGDIAARIQYVGITIIED